MTQSKESVAVIGAGPAGISAALQLVRYEIEPILFEKESVGGLLKNAHLVENYPGFVEGTSGPKLVALFQKQLERAKVQILFEEVKVLDFKKGSFVLRTNSHEFLFKVVVVATGTKARRFSLALPQKAKNKVFYEVYPLLKKSCKSIFIVGGGDAAFDYALNLAEKGNEVTILNRSTKVKCLPLLYKRAEECKRINYQEKAEITKIDVSQSGKLLLKGIQNCKEWQEETHYLLLAIGREPNLHFLSPFIKDNLESLKKRGLLYLVGDVKNERFRQLGICVGDGIKAAMKIAQHFKKEGNV